MSKKKERIKSVESDRYKVRVVVQGYSHKEGIDYNEVFSLVAKYTSIIAL